MEEHIMSMRVAVGTVVAIYLLACAGCNRPSGKALESTAEFQQIKLSLDESQKANEQLKQDAKKLDISLKQAESKLAEETKAKSGLQTQVQDLTVSRTSLEAKVDELSKARVALDTKVNDLQKTIDSLTKARDAALEDARNAQAKVEGLNDKVKAQTQQITDLQEQIKLIRSTLGQLQQKLQ
jgi:chromosome segregation ATPase